MAAEKKPVGLEALASIIKTKYKREDDIVDTSAPNFAKTKWGMRAAINQWQRRGFVGLGVDYRWLVATQGISQVYVEKYSLEKGFRVLSEYHKFGTKDLQVKCLNCGRVFITSFDCIKKSQTGCCLKCCATKRKDYYTYEKVTRKLRKHGFKLLTPKNEFKGVREIINDGKRWGKDIKYHIKCLKCSREYESVLRTRMRGIGCRFCGHFKGHSKFESIIAQTIKSNFVGLKFEVGNRGIIRPMELDFYIPELKLAIEYNGTYWHSDKMIKKRSRGRFQDAVTYHNTKTEMALAQGVKLIHLNEKDGNTYNKLLVVNHINDRIKETQLWA